MGKNTLLPKLIFVVFVIVLLGVGATYLAGISMMLFNKVPVKSALAQVDITTYYRYWHFYANDVMQAKPLKISAVAALVIAYGLPLVVIVAAATNGNKRALHGAARFANAQEIRKSGLLAQAGIIVGKWAKQFLMLPGQLFVMLAAPTRSGKGVSFVIPNALNWPGSLVASDYKEEIYKITAGFRKKYGQEVYAFRPFAEDYRSCHYNPLGYVRDGDFRVGDLISIGEVFYPSGASKDAFFDDQARNLFLGLGLLLFETPGLPCTIGEMLRQSSGKGQSIKDYLRDIINERNFILDEKGNIIGMRPWSEGDDGLPPLSDACVDSLNRFLSTSDNTRSSILASFNAPLLIWSNPIVDAATSSNDFDLRDIRKRAMSIYLNIPLDRLQEAGRLVSLFFTQLINLNTKELPEDNPAIKYEVLMLKDELTAIGKIPILPKAISYMAGFWLRAALVIQSPSQLERTYGVEDARTIMTNCAIQILFTPKEQRDANEYSEMLGYETVKGKSISRNIGGLASGPRNESESDQRRALMLPQELKEMSGDKQIVIYEGTKPIICDKIRYYQDPVFMSRLEKPPPVPLLDMETHRAMVQGRTREMTLADLEGGIDLNKLALNMSMLAIPPDEGATDEDVQRYVESFLAMLDEADCAPVDDGDLADCADDGTSPRPSDEEMAALAAMLAEDDETIRLEAYDDFQFDENPMVNEVLDDSDHTDEIIDLSVLTPGVNGVKVSHVV